MTEFLETVRSMSKSVIDEREQECRIIQEREHAARRVELETAKQRFTAALIKERVEEAARLGCYTADIVIYENSSRKPEWAEHVATHVASICTDMGFRACYPSTYGNKGIVRIDWREPAAPKKPEKEPLFPMLMTAVICAICCILALAAAFT